ncbi:MAG: RtcB family protein [Candidatus Paceibacteria bacterium]
MITGKTLIELGYKPAKWFGEAINYINENNLLESEYHNYIKTVLPPPTIEPFEYPVKYSKNISAENSVEKENILKVCETMDVLMKTPTVVAGCIMPDACPTGQIGQIPVGGVVVTRNAIHPSMHSSDMCCSLFATNLGKINPKEVLDISFETTQFGPGKRKGHNGWSNLLFDNKNLYNSISNNFYTKDYIEKAMMHLGTQGDGNHFLFVGISKNTGDTYLITHHGSRGFGASVYKKGMSIAEKYRKVLSPNTLYVNAWIPYEEKEGKLYWEAIQIVREWTKLNHTSIHQRIFNKLKLNPIYSFWNEHNSVFKDGDLFYHAKGATPLRKEFVPDEYEGLRIIPLNMSEPILFVKGESTSDNLGFAPHGAGRNFSRTEHINSKKSKTIDEHFKDETKGLDIRFYSGNIDISELPSAYKNAENVKNQIKKFNLGEIVDEILPYGCIMAGNFEYKN